jgi:hypothetical protein
MVEWSIKKWGAGTDMVEWSIKKWEAGTDMVEWSIEKGEAGTDVVKWWLDMDDTLGGCGWIRASHTATGFPKTIQLFCDWGRRIKAVFSFPGYTGTSEC